MKHIGELLRIARTNCGLNQVEAAKRARQILGSGFTRSALWQIENGSTKKPKPDNLQALCDVYGISFRSAVQDGELVYEVGAKRAKGLTQQASRGPERAGKSVNIHQKIDEMSPILRVLPMEDQEQTVGEFNELLAMPGLGDWAWVRAVADVTGPGRAPETEVMMKKETDLDAEIQRLCAALLVSQKRTLLAVLKRVVAETDQVVSEVLAARGAKGSNR